MNMVEDEKKNINKKDFIKKLSLNQHLSSKQVEIGVLGILDFLKNAFKQDCIIEVRGFGKFICKNGKVRFKSFIKYE
jgi:nucleoid DNA-binding protein